MSRQERLNSIFDKIALCCVGHRKEIGSAVYGRRSSASREPSSSEPQSPYCLLGGRVRVGNTRDAQDPRLPTSLPVCPRFSTSSSQRKCDTVTSLDFVFTAQVGIVCAPRPTEFVSVRRWEKFDQAKAQNVFTSRRRLMPSKQSGDEVLAVTKRADHKCSYIAQTAVFLTTRCKPCPKRVWR